MGYVSDRCSFSSNSKFWNESKSSGLHVLWILSIDKQKRWRQKIIKIEKKIQQKQSKQTCHKDFVWPKLTHRTDIHAICHILFDIFRLFFLFSDRETPETSANSNRMRPRFAIFVSSYFIFFCVSFASYCLDSISLNKSIKKLYRDSLIRFFMCESANVNVWIFLK